MDISRECLTIHSKPRTVEARESKVCRSWTRMRQDENMPILLKTQVESADKTPVTARRARVGGLCGFRGTAERVPSGSPKTGRCTAVRERWQKTSEQDEMAAGKAACGKCGKSLKMVKIEGFWTPRRESRINGWRRNRRFSCSQQPAVRTVSRGCAGAAIGACLKENTHGWRQKSHKRRRFKEFRRASAQNGGL